MATQLTQVTFPNGDYIISDNQPAVKQFVGGKIVNFNDGSSLPMPKLEIAVEPQQDLHGYDAPWVGGAGKNKANIADMNVQSQTTMGRLTLPSGTYVASATVKNNTSIGGAIKINTSSETLTVGEIPSASGTSRVSTASFTLSESTEISVVVSGALSGYNYDVSQVQIESGSTATTFAPYSNECPIIGWTEANVTRCGKNIATTEVYKNNYVLTIDGTENYASGFIITKEIKIDSSKSCYLSMIGEQSSSSDAIRVGFYDKFLNFISRIERSTPTLLTIPNNAEYIRLSYRNIAPYFKDIQIEIGDEATAYEPYNGHTYTIDLDGTRYGGKVDLVSGVLTVDKAEIDLGSRTYTKAVDGYFYAYISDISIINFNANEPTAECEIYKLCTSAEWYGRTIDSGIFGVESSHVIYIADTRFSDGDSLKTALVGKKLVYTLATPLTIQLTPTQVNSLMGVNNIWANSGKIIKVEYVRDKYDKITANISKYADKANTAIDAQTVNGHTVDKDVPSDAVFTDTNNAVTQTPTDSTDATYELLFSGTADNTTRTEGVRKTANLAYNPSTKTLNLQYPTTAGKSGAFIIKSNSNNMLGLYSGYNSGMTGIYAKNGTAGNTWIELIAGTDDLHIMSTDLEFRDSTNTWDGTNTSLKTAVTSAKGTVTQTATDSTNSTYELLFSGSANNTDSTEGTNKSQYATFNPSKKAFTFGSRLTGSTVGDYSLAEGNGTVASYDYSHAEGHNTTASGSSSHAEGSTTIASNGESHAEGYATTASGYTSHAESFCTLASGDYSHAEGQYTTASGMCSHAEGAGTTASGGGAHTEGAATIANHRSQHVFGEYNVPDPTTTSWWERGNYIEIVGNGTDDEHQSNARELDWNGNEVLAGKLTCTDVTSLESTWDGARSSLKAAIGKFKSNVGATVTVNANSYVDKTVNFGKTFSSAPIVVTQLTGSAANNTYRANTACYVTATTTTSFTVRIYNSSAAQLSISFNWIAMEV